MAELQLKSMLMEEGFCCNCSPLTTKLFHFKAEQFSHAELLRALAQWARETFLQQELQQVLSRAAAVDRVPAKSTAGQGAYTNRCNGGYRIHGSDTDIVRMLSSPMKVIGGTAVIWLWFKLLC